MQTLSNVFVRAHFSFVIFLILIASTVKSSAGQSNPIPLTGVSTVSVGGEHVCAIMIDTSVRCWGNNSYGQLGNGTTVGSPNQGISYLPLVVTGLSSVVSIAGGVSHTCAALANGTVDCWGDNSYGQLGNGTNTQSLVPIAVSGINNAIAVTAGYFDSCALLSDNSVACWGYNHEGELGNGTYDDSNTPVFVANGITALAMPSFQGPHSCGIGDWTWTGFPWSILCWGTDYGSSSNVPVPVISDIIPPPLPIWGEYRIATGDNFSCALSTDGTLICWGFNGDGQFGNGTQLSSMSAVFAGPSRTAGINNVVAGSSHTCLRMNDGSVECAGRNTFGQLGDNLAEPFSTTEVSVNGLSGATSQLSGGADTNCAVMSDSTVQCWGLGNGGMLGIGTAGAADCGESSPACSPTPVTVLVQVGSAISLTSNQNPTPYYDVDGDVLLYATVTSPYASGFQGGTVTFYEGDSTLCVVTEPAGTNNFYCSVPAANSDIGTHSYSAIYGGNTWSVGSDSNSYEQVVLDATDYVYANGFD